METIEEIINELDESAELFVKDGIDQGLENPCAVFHEYANRLRIAKKVLTERLERAETAWKNWNSAYCTEAAENVSLKEDNSNMKKVVDALNNCDGVKRCIEKGCESCRHNGHDCNSHEVVKALLEYMEDSK